MKKYIRSFLIISLGLLLVACGNQTKTGTQASTGKQTKQLVQKQEISVAVSQELNTIDPASAIDSNSAIAINNIYEGLYRLDEKNQPVVAGAKSLPTISKDGLTYTIQLNKQAKWSNGDGVTAENYVYAWKRAIGAKNAAENSQYFTSIVNADAIIAGKKKATTLGVEALDTYTIQIKLKVATPYFTTLLATPVFFPLEQAYVEKQGDKFGSDSKHALYNGPFTLTDFSGPGIGSNWTYAKNRHYWNAKSVKLSKIKVEVIKDTNTAINLFKSGKLDQLAVSGEYAQNEATTAGFVAEDASTIAFLGYNQTEKLYQNKKIREAISLVIGRDALVKNIFADGSKSATGIIPTGLYTNETTGKDFSKESGNYLKTDIKKAKKLWAEGKKEVGLSDVTIRFITFESDRMKTFADNFQESVQKNLEGAKVETSVLPVSVFIENATKGSFDIYVATWGADYPDATSLLKLFQSDSGNNWGHYQNTAYDAALAEAETTNANHSEARWNNLLTAQKIILKDYGVAPIYFQSSSYLRNPKLKNVLYHTSGPTFDYKDAYLKK